MSKLKLMSPATFSGLVPTLHARLTNDLRREQEDCALPDLNKNPLWDTPEVDSKTVAKLSPAVKELTGNSLDPRWIQKGGYHSVEEAVIHIISQLKLNLVVLPVAPVITPAEEVLSAVH
jgi:hypothetical protein